MISVDNPLPVWYNLGMKGKQQMKTKAKKPASSTEFYVVAWSDYDPNEEAVATGTLSDIFSTKKKAQNAIMRCILERAKDDMSMYAKSEWKEIFGTEDPKEVAAKSIRVNTGTYFEVESENCRSQYTIDKFDLKFIK